MRTSGRIDSIAIAREPSLLQSSLLKGSILFPIPLPSHTRAPSRHGTRDSRRQAGAADTEPEQRAQTSSANTSAADHAKREPAAASFEPADRHHRRRRVSPLPLALLVCWQNPAADRRADRLTSSIRNSHPPLRFSPSLLLSMATSAAVVSHLPPSRRSDQIDGNELILSDDESPTDDAETEEYDAETAQMHLPQQIDPEATAPPLTMADAAAAAALAVRQAHRKERRRVLRPRDAAHGSLKSSADDDGCSCCVKWLGPGSAVLWLFTLCQLMIFYDRGMVAGFLPSIQEDLGTLSDTQMGLLGSGFIFGYMLACPLFAFFSKSYSPYKLMSIGLFLWVNAVCLCGLTDNFITLLGARILTGVGEASFAGLAPTCIDDVAPLAHRTIWLSFFFSGVPIGSALGYISGGWFAGGLGWHYGFLTEAMCMAPMVVIVFFWPNHAIDEEGEEEAQEEAVARKIQAEQTEADSRAAAEWRAHRSQGGDRLYAEPPHPDSAFYPSAEPLSPAQPQLSAPAAVLQQSAGPLMNRSISTPALRRLDDQGYPAVVAAAAAAGPMFVDTDPSAETDQSQAELSYGDEDDEKHSGGQVTSQPELQRSASGNYIAPPSPAPLRTSHHQQQVMRGARTPTLRSQHEPYIVPDPRNPYHQPGQHNYREAIHAVSTPGPNASSGWNPRRGVYGAVDNSLPSPGSFNPHYANLDPQRFMDSERRKDELFVGDIGALLTDGVYIVVVLGYAALAFVIGALSFWAPVDFSKTLGISISRSTQIIGVITFSCGLGGTFFGGWCLDKRGGARGIFAVISALELCCVFVSLSIVFALGAVLATDLTMSMICLALADFFLFGTGAPVNAALLSVAPRDMRSLAMAMSILLMHALGDLPSPFLMGYITDQVNSIQLALVILCLWLLWTVFFWSIGVALARRRAEAFKAVLRLNMSRPIHERTALLGGTGAIRGPRGSTLERRGSTGQFYSSGVIPHPHPAAPVVAHAPVQHPGQRRYRPFEDQQQQPQQPAYASYQQQSQQAYSGSGPSTPLPAPRRSRSAAGTPTQQSRRISSGGYTGQASPGPRSYSPSPYEPATNAVGYAPTFAQDPAALATGTPSRKRSSSDLQRPGEFKQQPPTL